MPKENRGHHSHETMTLEFEDAQTVQALYGGNEKLLRTAEDTLGIYITTRDGWLRIEGTPSNITRARNFFDDLDKQRRQGILLGRYEFLQTLQHATSEITVSSIERIQCSWRKPPIVPKSESQRLYLHQIDQHDITFGIGPAGTGKTYLAMAKAVAALKQEQVARIILTRPAVEAGEALGFLPGELQEKIFPYLRPLYDALYEMLEPDEIQRLLDKNIIEIAPLAYMRGRTLNNAFIVLDESQNTTTEQMFMFLTRIGLGSRCVIAGDCTQTNLPKNKPSGLIEALEALQKTAGIAFHYFTKNDVVRHSLVQEI